MIISTDVDLIISKETKSVEIRKMQDRKVLINVIQRQRKRYIMRC